MLQPLATVFILLVSLVVMMDATASDQTPPKFSITTKRDTDKVVVYVESDTTVFSIRSPSGISNAVIERAKEQWPHRVMLNLHLKGLENFQVTNGKATLEAAVSSHDEKMRFRLWKDKREDVPLDSKSGYWMEIRMVGPDGRPANAIPLKCGYFEMKLPKLIFEDNPKSITISWIDFYRG